MNSNANRTPPKAFRQQEAITKLADELANYSTDRSDTTREDIEMLSMVFDEVLNGKDIAARFPAFYRKLLDNANLRQAFLDLVEAVQDEKSSQSAFPQDNAADLSFLNQPADRPLMENSSAEQWRITWQRSIDYLQSIFSPPELAYRMDSSLYEDPWVTLLRGETRVNDHLYSVLLDCSLAQDSDNSLAVNLSLAVSGEADPQQSQVPLRASLNWGGYDETILMNNEGRVRFPDIPLGAIFDEAREKVTAELNLTLETAF